MEGAKKFEIQSSSCNFDIDGMAERLERWITIRDVNNWRAGQPESKMKNDSKKKKKEKLIPWRKLYRWWHKAEDMINYQASPTNPDCQGSSEKGDFLSLNQLEEILKRREDPADSNKHQLLLTSVSFNWVLWLDFKHYSFPAKFLGRV